jgi:glycosyltransferase involved in cell wall biosynthesis
MRIVVVHSRYQQHGGEQTAVEAQVALLREHGHEVVLYARDNAEIERYDVWQRAALFPATVFSRRTYREIRSLAARSRPDVVHLHNVFPLISPSIYRALRDAQVPTIQTVHNFRFLCPNGLFYTHGQICERCKRGNTFHAVRLRCYRQSYILSALYAAAIGLHRRWGTFAAIDRFIALTEFVAQKLAEGNLTTPDKISVLGNFLPDPLPAPGSAERREPYVVYLGRLSFEKGVQVLIETMARLPDLNLKILGGGPIAGSLQKLTRDSGSSNIEFLGHVAGEEKWQLVRNAMAVLIPSVCYETFSLAALESMAVATPVFASNVGGIPYVVEDRQSGLLFRPGDRHDLQQKLAWLVNHPREAAAMGRTGRKIVESRYSAESHYRRLMAIYDEVKA